MSVSNKRSAEEIFLLQGITSTLESNLRSNCDIDEDYDVALPSVAIQKSKTLAPMQHNQKAKLAVDVSQKAVKNFLAEKTLIKSFTKACSAERVVPSDANIIEELVKKYRNDYSGLTVKKVVDGINRAVSGNVEKEASCEKDGNNNINRAGAESEVASQDKVVRCAALIDEEMKQYYVKIAELKAKRRKKEAKTRAKRKRDQVAAAAAAAAVTNNEDGTTTATTTVTAIVHVPKKSAKRKRTSKNFEPKSKFKFVDPDDALYEEMTERYYKIKETNEHLPSRTLEKIIEETKKDMHRDDFDKPYRNVYNEIKKRWRNRSDVGATTEGEKIKRIKDMYEELYKRYCELKSSQKKLSGGTLAELSVKVKEEFGLSDFPVNKNRITYRYRREFPEHKSNPDHVVEIRTLSSEDKKRREYLVNEVVARYLKEKDANPKKLANGSIKRIIDQTKEDLDIHDFDVPESSIRGRIHRKSFFVSHENGNLDDIDELLVDTINSWLKKDIKVTRDQGLQLANQMLAANNLHKDSDGNTITLDAVWWKCFLNRNHHKLNTERTRLS
ncbi:hypothetical protein ACHAXM_009428 [Skeletonema potamos]